MTVSELRDLLESLPDDAVVVGYEGDAEDGVFWRIVVYEPSVQGLGEQIADFPTPLPE